MDENRPDNIDKLFKDSLQSFRERPPNDVWKRIEHQLDSDDKRIYLARFRYVLLISACLLALFISQGILFRPMDKTVAVHNGNASSGLHKEAYVNRTNRPYTPEAKKPIGMKNLNVFPMSHKAAGPGKNALPGVIIRDEGAVQYREMKVSLSGIYPQLVSLQPTAPIFSASPPDQNHQLLTEQIGMFNKIRSVGPLHVPGRWSVTGYFSKEFAGYNLSDHDSTGANGREIDKKEKSIYSASAVVVVSYKLFGRWSIQSGLGYSWSNSIANPTTSYAVVNNGEIKFRVNTVSGFGYLSTSTSVVPNVGDSVITDKSYSRLRYLTIPLIASYRFKIKRLTLLAGMGVTVNFLAGATLESKLQDPIYNQNESTVSMYGLKRINCGVLLKTELQYPIYPGWSIDLVSSFKNTLTPINIHTSYSTYPFNLGIGLGISHAF